jgi:hypothetical protein
MKKRDLTMYEKIILNCILKTLDDRTRRIGLFQNRAQAMVGCCGKGNKPSASTQPRILFD